MAESWVAPEEEFLAAINDDDRVYEEIEAPKFVDLSAPEPSRPDGASWFCARIGCDQQHVEIDPDTIHKNFVLRVMAARSPNVRFQRLLHRQARSAIQKCPKTEPVCVNDHRLRFAEKIENVRLRAHPISSLRSTTNVKARIQPSVGVKDMNTPCSRKRPCTAEALSVSKSKNLGTPQSLHGLKKVPNSATPMISQTPEFQICSAMKRLKIDSQTKGAVEHSLKTSSCPWRSRSNVKARQTPLKSHIEIDKNNYILDKEKDGNKATSRKKAQAVVNNTNYTDSRGYKKGFPVSIKHGKSSVPEGKALEGGQPAEIEGKKDQENDSKSSSNCDDDKENTSAIYNSRELLNSEKENANCEPWDLSSKKKSTTTPGHENSMKHKKIKPTNIKPFRFRTDERGILKEANAEKKSQLEDPKEIKTTGPFSEKNLGNEKFSNQKKKLMKSKLSAKGRGVLKSNEEEEAGLMTTTPSRVRKRTIVPKEPIFQQMHLPRSCTKRPAKSVS